MIAGIGFVSGIRCMVMASDSGIDAGALQPMGLDKLLRVQELTLENKLPYVQLVESAGALRLAFDSLFPDGIVDRTDLRIASNNSACGADVAAYLTGARTRFGSHLIDQKLTESEFVVQQVSTGKTVRVRVRPEAYPTDVRTQMRKIESGQFSPEDIDLFQELQWAYAKKIVTRPLTETFALLDSAGYVWPEAPCKNYGSRRDNAYKAVPAR